MAENECCDDVVVRTPSFFAEISTATQTTQALEDLADTLETIEGVAAAAEASSVIAEGHSNDAETHANNASASASNADSFATDSENSSIASAASASSAASEASDAGNFATSAGISAGEANDAEAAAELAEAGALAAQAAAELAEDGAEAAEAAASGFVVGTVVVSGSTLNLDSTHINRLIEFTNAAGCVVTVQTVANGSFTDNCNIHLCQAGTGVVSLVEESGVTIFYPATKLAELAEQHAVATLYHRGSTEEWRLFGALGE